MPDNTIEGLRVLQWGFEGVRAAGTLSVPVNPVATETIVIGDVTYTFVAAGAVAGQINIGANAAATQVNIVAAINGTDGINTPNPAASAAAFAANDSVITARQPGVQGDDIVFTETMAGAGNQMNGGGTLGGTTAGSAAKGTAVAATSKMSIEELDWGDDDENLYHPRYLTGILARTRGAPVAVQHGLRFGFSDQPLPFEQLPHWLSMVVKGGVVPVYVPGSPSVYRWTFTRAPDTNPNPNSVTLQRRFSDGLGNNVDQRAAYCMLEQWSLKYAENEPLKMSGRGFARAPESSAITGALTLPTTEIGVSALSTLYRDSAWAGVGGTLVAEQVVAWELQIGTGVFPQYTAEGRSGLDFTKHQIDANNVTLGLTGMLLLNPTQYATEKAAADAGTVRAMQVKVTGSGGRSFKCNALMRYEKPGLLKIDTMNGQDVVSFEMREAPDSTNFYQCIVDHPSVYDLT